MTAFVQHTQNTVQFTSGTSGVATATFGSNTGAGNTLVACIGLDGGGATPTISSVTTNGSAENWAKAVSDSSVIVSTFTNPGTAGGQTVIDVNVTFGFTATTSSSVAVVVDIFEFSGMLQSSVVDKTSANDQSTTAWTSNATASTTHNVEVLVGFDMLEPGTANATGTITGPTGSWINESTGSTSYQNGGTGTTDKFFMYQLAGYQITSTTGTATYSGTSTVSTGSATNFSAVVTLIGASSGIVSPQPGGKTWNKRFRRKQTSYPGGHGTTYYVSNSGSDSNNGTSQATPFQTIGHVNGLTLYAGDSVLFNGGNTFSGTMLQPAQSGTISAPITFGSYGAGNATITTSASTAIYVYEVGGITFENLTITGPGASTAGAGGYVGVYFNKDTTGYANAITVTNCTITGWQYGVLVAAADSAGGYNGITISNNSVSVNRDSGINISGSGSSQYSHLNVVVTGNSTFNQTGYSGNTTTSSGHGIVVGNVNGGVISYNTAYGNGASCGCTGAGPVGIWGYTIENVIFEYNVSYSNKTAGSSYADGDGFDLDDQCINCTLQYNIAYSNDGAGIACYSDDSTWSGNVIRYNITWGNSVTNPDEAEIMFLDGAFSNCDVYGNTFIGQTNAELPSVILLYGASFTSVNFWNNIIYTAASGTSIMYTDTAYTGVTFQGNLWYSAAPFGISWGGTDYTSMAAWQTATGQEKLSGSPVGIQANPLLVNASATPSVTSPFNLTPADGLELSPGSPCVQAGLNLQSDFTVNPGTQDFFGNTLTTPLSIGAYQVSPYSTTITAPTLVPSAIYPPFYQGNYSSVSFGANFPNIQIFPAVFTPSDTYFSVYPPTYSDVGFAAQVNVNEDHLIEDEANSDILDEASADIYDEGFGGNASITTTVLSVSTAFPSVTVNAGAGKTTTVLAGSVSFPSVTITASSGVTTSVLNGSVSFSSPTVTASTGFNGSVLAGSVSFPSPSISTSDSITTTVLAGSVSFPAPSIPLSTSITTTVLNGSVSFSSPEVMGSVLPSVLNGSVSFSAPSVSASINVTPSVLAVGVTSWSAPTVSTSDSITTTVLAGTVLFPWDWNLTTVVLSGTVSFSAPTVNENNPFTTSVLSGSVSFPSPTIATGESTTTSVLNGSVSFSAPTITAGTAITTSVLSGSVAFSAPSISTDQDITTSVLSTGVSFPSPSVSTSGNVNINAVVLSGSVSFPSASVTTGLSLTPSVLNGTVSFASPSLITWSDLTTSVLSTSASFTSPSITIFTAVLAGSVSFPSVTINQGDGTTPSVLATSTAFPSPVIKTGENLTTSVLSVSATFSTSLMHVSEFVTTTVLSGSVVFPSVTVSEGGGAGVNPSTLSASVSFPSATINVSEVIPVTALVSDTSFSADMSAGHGTVVTDILLSGSSQFSGATVTVSVSITPNILAASTDFPSAITEADAVIVTEELSGSVAFYAPDVASIVNQSITPVLLSSQAIFSPPVTTAKSSIHITTSKLSCSTEFTVSVITYQIPVVQWKAKLVRQQ